MRVRRTQRTRRSAGSRWCPRLQHYCRSRCACTRVYMPRSLTTLCIVQCYELIGAGLFAEALEKWKFMIDKDGPNADTQNFQAQIKAGLKASKKKGQARK